MSLAKIVNVELQGLEIRDIYRINSSKESIKPLIVELNSAIKKDAILTAVRAFNKGRATGDKLNSEHLKIKGPSKPVFVSETLTFKAQKLHYLAREFAKEYNYKFCWTSKGVVYLRHSDGKPFVRIDEDADLAKLKTAA